MMLFLAPVLLLSVTSISVNSQQLDPTQLIIDQINAVNNQIALSQLILAEIAAFTADSFEAAARNTLGNDAEVSNGVSNDIPVVLPNIPGLRILVDNLVALQSLMRDLRSEFERIVTTRINEPKRHKVLFDSSSSPSSTSSSSSSSGSKTNTTTITSTETQTSGAGDSGPQAASNAANTLTAAARGPGEVLIRTIDTASQQFSQVSRAITDVTGQFTKFIATSSKLLTGFRGNPGLTEAALNSLEEFSRQFQEIQKGLRLINTHFNRMIEIGSRAIGGDKHHYQSFSDPPNPGQAALNVLSTLNSQLVSALRILEDVNGQFNRIIATSSRIITGGHHKKRVH